MNEHDSEIAQLEGELLVLKCELKSLKEGRTTLEQMIVIKERVAENAKMDRLRTRLFSGSIVIFTLTITVSILFWTQ